MTTPRRTPTKSRTLAILLLGAILASTGLAAATDTTDYSPSEGASSGGGPGAANPAVLIFQDSLPWGSNRVQTLLTAHGIPHATLPTSEMGTASLTGVTRIVFSSSMACTAVNNLLAHKDRMLNFVAAGGVFQLHGSTQSDCWQPASTNQNFAGFVPVFSLNNGLSAYAPGHALLTTPNNVNVAAIGGFSYTSHNYLWTPPTATYVVVTSASQVALAVAPYGSGQILATGMTIEYSGHSQQLLENMLLYAYAAPPAAPGAPSLTATTGLSPGTIGLSWSAPDEGSSPITGYNVYRGTSPGSLALLASGIAGLAMTDSGLTNGATYYYAVSAVNNVGEGAQSAEASAVAQVGAPDAPVLTVLTGLNPGEVELSWTTPYDGGSPIVSYDILRGTSPGSLGIHASDVAGNAFTDLGDPGATYYYAILAKNFAGHSPPSNEEAGVAGAAPPVLMPEVPTLVLMGIGLAGAVLVLRRR